ncbi:MAG: glycerophosphodiester phosphodiesterase [Candidatus Thorarchaeota archaeon]|nr:glycerophosphodiester phosphodiesterase [Candidatus Thorarchaeota archaeon]
MQKPLVIGHRGAPNKSPENTMQSFESAIHLGADMIELDVRESADGQLVIIHDYDVERVSTKEGIVVEMSLQELKSLDLGDGARIPTLEQVLDTFQGRIKVNIELKVPDIESKTLAIVSGRNMINDVIFSSFYHMILTEIKVLDNKVNTAVLYEHPLEDPVSYALELGASAINPLYTLLDPEIISKAHASNLQVYPWTVNDEEAIEDMVSIGVDGVITDFPDLCRTVVDRLTE